MAENSIKGSLFWKFLERGGVQAIQFVLSIVIARILDPSDYGSVALLTVFISIATIFVQSGLGTALIQKKDADETDYSSVFYYCLGTAALLYGILYTCAGWIADFYKMPELVPLLRVLALILFPGAINSIQVALLSKFFKFKKQFYSSIIAVTLSGAIGLAMAFLGFGAWALVGQQLSYQVIICISLLVFVRWVPSFKFSYARTKELLSYGMKLLGARLVDTIYHNLESLIIGKQYSAEILAFCNKGKQFPMTLIDNIDGSIQSVMLPAYSVRQDDIQEVKALVRKSVSLSTYLVFPAMLILAAIGEPLILSVLGDKWKDSVIYLQLFCVVAMLFPLQTTCLQAINALGKSGVFFKVMTIKRVLGVIILFSAVFLNDSPLSVVVAAICVEILGVLINILPNKKHINYTLWEQLCDFVPNLILSMVSAAIVYSITLFGMNCWITLCIQCIVGIVVFILLSYITKNKGVESVLLSLSKYKHER